MRKVVLFLLLVLTGFLQGQNYDALMIHKQIDCEDISYNSGLYFVKYLQEEKFDSAQNIIEYWEGKCGEREPIFRAKILLALKNNSFNDSLLTQNTLKINIYNYIYRVEMIKNSNYYWYDENKAYFGYTPVNQDFDKVTQKFAESLKKQYSPETIEYLLAEFYSGNVDEIFEKLQREPFKDSPLGKEYHEEVAMYTKQGEFHCAWITGLWIPTGDLTPLGLHPEVGWSVGAKVGKMNYDLVLAFKFLNAANPYTGYRDGVAVQTDNFFGAYMGFEVGRDMYVRNGHELQIVGGVAVDGFDVLDANREQGIESKSTFSYNFNLGVSYRYYITNDFYLGIRTKYNLVDYSMNGVTDFKNDPITIQFTIGGLYNMFKKDGLIALKYTTRK